MGHVLLQFGAASKWPTTLQAIPYRLCNIIVMSGHIAKRVWCGQDCYDRWSDECYELIKGVGRLV